jgi:flagellin-specific chaperone FliS
MISQLVPILAEAIKPTLQTVVECAFKSMTDAIQKQVETIEKQNQQISDLTERLDTEKSNQDLQHQIWGLYVST